MALQQVAAEAAETASIFNHVLAQRSELRREV